jgi:SAM-dependent methyltransferase
MRAAYADPRTGAALLWDEDRVSSIADGNSYPVVRGVPNFLAGPAEDSPEPVERFDRLHRLAPSLGWRKALEAVDGDVDPYLTDPRRARYLELLPLDGARVLEIGASLGQHTLSIARRAASVHALEISPGQAQFIIECCRHERLANVSVSCGGDDCRLPFATAWFDCVVLNLVFEWCGFRSPEGHVAAQRLLLSEMARVLRPGGVLWLHTKNRHALRRLLGGRDEHLDGMRFGYALPNRLVTAYLRATGRGRAQGLLHSHDALALLIRSHGFSEVRSFWAAPEMRYPSRFIPCDTGSIRAARRQKGFVQGETRLTRMIMPWVPARWVRHVMPGLAFFATRAGQPLQFNTARRPHPEGDLPSGPIGDIDCARSRVLPSARETIRRRLVPCTHQIR